MYGLETLGPVVTAVMPGTFVMASIIFVLMFETIVAWLTETIGMGLRFICVALDKPVTTTSLSSTIFSCN